MIIDSDLYYCPEGNIHWEGDRPIYFTPYMMRTPIVITTEQKVVETINMSPYVDKETHTLWQYDANEMKYIDTGIEILTKEDLENALANYQPD